MDAVERLRGSLAAAGLKVPEGGYAQPVLDELEQELAPLRLPVELRDLYERVVVAALAFGPGIDVAEPFTPWLADLAQSWWLWRAIRDRPGRMPETLLPVVWYGGVMQLVELADDASPGGAMFEWRRGSGQLDACHPGVAAWLDVLADVVADDGAQLLELGEEERWLKVSDGRERELRQQRGAPETGGLVSAAPATWPARWRAISSRFADRRPRRDAELSVSEFLWELPDAATVSGLLRHGTSRPGPVRLLLADGTGWLDVWCPAELAGLWMTDRETAVELEVTPFAAEWPPAVSDPEWPPYPPQAAATALRLRAFG